MAILLTAGQMRAVEQAAIAAGEVTGQALMERAGQGVVDAIAAEWPGLTGDAVVLCGPGNNGGDGFVVARLLVEAGWGVAVFLHGEAEDLPPDAAENYRRWRALGPVTPLTEAGFDGWFEGHPETVLCVDALFGIGLSRPLDGLRRVEMELNGASPVHGVRVVAVDVPSGMSADTGRFPGFEDANPREHAVQADLTVTFHSMKPGHMLADGPMACGKVVVVDIGLGVSDVPGAVVQVDQSGLVRDLAKRVDQHKYDHGYALVLTGPPGAGGAARMAARAALRIGAGLVTLGCPMRAVTENAVQLNAIMVRGLDGTAGLAEALEDTRINAVCLGPALGLGPATGELVKVALRVGRGTVLDADALSRFQRAPEALFEMLHDKVVLTPHGGEFRRLFPDLAQRLEEDPLFSRIDAVRAAAARAGCVVLLKGAATVIADPLGVASVHAAVYGRATPWLATAGAGDVLAGMICGLLARGLAPMRAAEVACWMHAEAARLFGPGLIAEDLPEMLPRVLREVGC